VLAGSPRSPLERAMSVVTQGQEPASRDVVLIVDDTPAEKGVASWLIDEIALPQIADRKIAAEPFQIWTLDVRADAIATLSCDDGDGNLVFTKELEFTISRSRGSGSTSRRLLNECCRT
jgi:hypothetical protein